MHSRLVLAIGMVSLGGFTLRAQDTQVQQVRHDGAPLGVSRAAASLTRQVFAEPIPSGTLRVDGRLADLAWRDAQWISDFTQREPVEGAVPELRTEVAFFYDEDAL